MPTRLSGTRTDAVVSTRQVTDREGVWEVTTTSSGIQRRVLLSPTTEYRDAAAAIDTQEQQEMLQKRQLVLDEINATAASIINATTTAELKSAVVVALRPMLRRYLSDME